MSLLARQEHFHFIIKFMFCFFNYLTLFGSYFVYHCLLCRFPSLFSFIVLFSYIVKADQLLYMPLGKTGCQSYL